MTVLQFVCHLIIEGYDTRSLKDINSVMRSTDFTNGLMIVPLLHYATSIISGWLKIFSTAILLFFSINHLQIPHIEVASHPIKKWECEKHRQG